MLSGASLDGDAGSVGCGLATSLVYERPASIGRKMPSVEIMRGRGAELPGYRSSALNETEAEACTEARLSVSKDDVAEVDAWPPLRSS
ncbi:hypothetical protein [Oribacterium sp. HCP3S3_B9]|uniref:hypothetical protein n=1 Tax=Oribacterium sp. HCP3S3_B9 TaxID=3438946 RepID=UPI003F8A17B8